MIAEIVAPARRYQHRFGNSPQWRGVCLVQQGKETIMDKEHIKGAAKDAEGKIKETLGKATDNEEMEAEGEADQLEGEARKAAGDVKDAFKKD